MSNSNDQELYTHRRLQILEQQRGGARNQFLSIIVNAAGPDSYSNYFPFYNPARLLPRWTLHYVRYTPYTSNPGRGYCGVESYH